MSEYTTCQDDETATREPSKQIAVQNDVDTAKEAIATIFELFLPTYLSWYSS